MEPAHFAPVVMNPLLSWAVGILGALLILYGIRRWSAAEQVRLWVGLLIGVLVGLELSVVPGVLPFLQTPAGSAVILAMLVMIGLLGRQIWKARA